MVLTETQAQARTESLGEPEKHNQKYPSIRARVEHVFRAIKRQFGFIKVHYRGLTKECCPGEHAGGPDQSIPVVRGSCGLLERGSPPKHPDDGR